MWGGCVSPGFEPIKPMALCSGSLRPPISSWSATRVGGEGNRDAMPKRSELSGSIDPYRFTMPPTRMSS
jgi:hypothetical protein